MDLDMGTKIWRTTAQYRLLNALDLTPGRTDHAATLVVRQGASADDLCELWSSNCITASVPLTGAINLAEHLDAGGHLNLIKVKLTSRGVSAVSLPTNRVLRTLHPRKVLSADQVMGDTGTDRSLLADMIDRVLIRANYPPTGNQDVPGELLRAFAIPTAHVMIRLARYGKLYMPREDA